MLQATRAVQKGRWLASVMSWNGSQNGGSDGSPPDAAWRKWIAAIQSWARPAPFGPVLISASP